MDDRDTLIRDLIRRLKRQNLAVLSKHNTGHPYASLVSFTATPDLKQLLFATTRSTRKFVNLTSDARAAMLVDNRSNEEADIHAAMAVTSAGVVREISKTERLQALVPDLWKARPGSYSKCPVPYKENQWMNIFVKKSGI